MHVHNLRQLFSQVLSYQVLLMNKIIKTQVTGMLCNMNGFLLPTQLFNLFNNYALNYVNNCLPMKENNTSSLQILIHFQISTSCWERTQKVSINGMNKVGWKPQIWDFHLKIFIIESLSIDSFDSIHNTYVIIESSNVA